MNFVNMKFERGERFFSFFASDGEVIITARASAVTSPPKILDTAFGCHYSLTCYLKQLPSHGSAYVKFIPVYLQ
jgi:hypothetical protein